MRDAPVRSATLLADTLPRGRVIRLARITRAMVRADRRTVWVFGDNMEGRGLGGQAAAMRGEPNSVGVPTKWRPDRTFGAYFTDDDWRDGDVRHAIIGAFTELRAALDAGRDVVIPVAGLGAGLAELPTRAPALHARIERAIARLEEGGDDA